MWATLDYPYLPLAVFHWCFSLDYKVLAHRDYSQWVPEFPKCFSFSYEN